MIPKFKPIILSTVPDKDKSVFDSPFMEKNQKLGKRWRRTSFLISQLFIVVPILILIAYLSLTESSNKEPPGSAIIFLMSVWLPILIMFLSFIPIVITQFFATAGRLRDIGADPNLALMFFVPVLGQIQMLYLLFASPDVGPNKYGPDPRGIKSETGNLNTCNQALQDNEQQECADISINKNDIKNKTLHSQDIFKIKKILRIKEILKITKLKNTLDTAQKVVCIGYDSVNTKYYFSVSNVDTPKHEFKRQYFLNYQLMCSSLFEQTGMLINELANELS